MTSPHGIGRRVAATMVRDAIPYGAAAVLAAASVVALFVAMSFALGERVPTADLPTMLVYAILATLVYAFPASVLLIGIGEWRGWGWRGFAIAGSVAAVASFTGILALASGASAPWTHYGLVAIGGLVGGLSFWLFRRALIRLLGDPAAISPAP